jgi:serine/threonine-protein kinase
VIADKYHVLGRLGVGGHSAVFEAENTWTGRRVALKVLFGAAALHPEMSERFLREARATTRVAHPNIVEVLDMGRDPRDGTLFIVQELLHGEDLRHCLRRERTIDPQRLIGLIVPVLEALAAAHAQGIVHRDLKPANIYLAQQRDGHIVPKIIDFGVSRMDDTLGAHEITHDGALLGTPDYMSPEQARGERADARSDVWAIGVILFEALAGQKPYRAANYNALLVQIIADNAPSLRSVAPTVPEALAAVVDRALAHDPNDRFPSATALRDALLACVPSLTAPPAPAPPLPKAEPPTSNAPIDDPTPTSVEPPARLHAPPPEPHLPSLALPQPTEPHRVPIPAIGQTLPAGTLAAWEHRPAPSEQRSLAPWVLLGVLLVTAATVVALRIATRREAIGSPPMHAPSAHATVSEALPPAESNRPETLPSPGERPTPSVAPPDSQSPVPLDGSQVARPNTPSPPPPRPSPRSRTPIQLPLPSPSLERPTPSELRRVMLSASPEVARCVNHREGIVQVRLTILGAGTVNAVTVDPPWRGTPAAACVALVLQRLRFSPFRQPSFQLSWPYVVPSVGAPTPPAVIGIR